MNEPNNNTLSIGDNFTIAGQYKRRTFWQWLRRKERQIQQFKVIATNKAFSEYEADNG